MKVTHYIPKLQGSLQQGMTLSTVTEHKYTQAVEINEFYYQVLCRLQRKFGLSTTNKYSYKQYITQFNL